MAKITLDIDDKMLKKILEDEDYMIVFFMQLRKLLEDYKTSGGSHEN